MIRAQTLTLRSRDFVAASRETGERRGGSSSFEILPNEVSLIAASFVGTVLYAILTSVALAFIGVGTSTRWSLARCSTGRRTAERDPDRRLVVVRAARVAVALLGMSLVLLNFGLDELGNPRLRDSTRRRARSAAAPGADRPDARSCARRRCREPGAPRPARQADRR